jgi:hypothetical protein
MEGRCYLRTLLGIIKMNKQLQLMLVTAIGITLSGCGATAKEIVRMGRSERIDVFTEVRTEGEAPAGFADLVIKAALKTPLEGHYVLESKESVHGKPGFSFLVNIDGQAVLWKVDGQKEMVPLYDERGKASPDPEAGAGMKYILERKVRLAAGKHRLFFALPEEPYYIMVKITLKEAETNILEFKPRYRYKTVPTRIPTFLLGVDSYEITLNGRIIGQE